jgi:Flp pilus assembly pilin Flp
MNELLRNPRAEFAFGAVCANSAEHTTQASLHCAKHLELGVTTMKRLLTRMWREDDGVLSFEWTVLTSLLTVGVVSGIASVRDAVIDEMGDLSQAIISLDQSYYIQPPLAVEVHTWGWGWGYGGGWGFGGASGASDSGFVDAAAHRDCYRVPPMKVQEFPRRGQTVPGAPPRRIPDAPPAEPVPAL